MKTRPACGHELAVAVKDAERRIRSQLKTPWSDGTTAVIYEPLDLIAKLAALAATGRS